MCAVLAGSDVDVEVHTPTGEHEDGPDWAGHGIDATRCKGGGGTEKGGRGGT